MKKIIGIMGSIILIFTGCVTEQAQADSASIVIHVSEGTELQARIKTAHGNAVEVHGSETQKIAGTDEVRKFCEEKSMQKVTTQETTLTFRGDIREFDIKDNKAVSDS